MTTEGFVDAVAVTSVVCPEWCETSQEQHLNDLGDLEGYCHHDAWWVGEGWSIRLGVLTLVDGSPDGRPGLKAGPRIGGNFNGDLSPQDALGFAEALVEAVALTDPAVVAGLFSWPVLGAVTEQ